VKTLPAVRAVPPILADDQKATVVRKTTFLGWTVTLIPRVGIVRPF
jgi:hypothetical protein